MHRAPQLPTFDDVLEAAARIAPVLRPTPVLDSAALDALAGCRLAFKAEHLQPGGAFKLRGATNAVAALDATAARAGVATHSSGNHGGALARAARARRIACHVVVPEGAVPGKLAAIAAEGAVLHHCAATMAAREAACTAIVERTGATLVHPYADARVIAGQGTAALEFLGERPGLDVLVVPVGGGGLAAGTALALAAIAPRCRLVLAEPAGADDTHASPARGEHTAVAQPDTLCDGLRATIGLPNFEILRAHAPEVVRVEDADTVAAMRLAWQHLRQVVEPSSAIALAAVLARRERFAGLQVGIVLTGGNVDLGALPWAA
jgi:threonine dehydratase